MFELIWCLIHRKKTQKLIMQKSEEIDKEIEALEIETTRLLAELSALKKENEKLKNELLQMQSPIKENNEFFGKRSKTWKRKSI